MPRYYPNSLISDCWSSIGNITFYHRDGLCYWRKKSTLQFVGSSAQLKALDVHRRALRAWSGLSHETQLEWNHLAKDVSAHKPPFIGHNSITGHNLFVSAYHGFCTLGNEHTPEPKVYEPFPDFFLEFVTVEVINSIDMVVKFRLTIIGSKVPSRYAVLGKVQLQEAGRGCNPGKMKNVLSVSSGNFIDGSTDITFTIPNYVSFCGFELTSYSLHLRYLLIDTYTGYRNNYKSLSCLLNLI